MTGGGCALACVPWCSMCPPLFTSWAPRGDRRSWRRVHGAVAAVDHTAVLDRPPWQRMDRRPRAAEPYTCRAAERSGPSHPPLRRRHLPISFLPFRLCDASDRTPCTRWSARPAADDCSSGSIRSFAVMSGFTKLRQGHRRSTRPGVMCHGPGGWYWLAGRRSATENWDAFEAPRGEPFLTAPPTSDWRQAHRALSSLAIELDASAREAQSAKPQSTKPGTHGSVSPTCGGERTDNSCSSISRGPRRSRRTPIRLSVLSSCWRRSPLAHLLPSLSRPRRCRPQRCCIDLRANRRQRSLMSRRSSCASHRFPVVPRAAVGPCRS